MAFDVVRVAGHLHGRPGRLAAAALAVTFAISGLACRQVAGIEDVERVERVDAGPMASNDAGSRCDCAGCTVLASGLGFPVGLVLVGSDLFVTDYGLAPGEGTLLRVPTGGGAVKVLENGLVHPSALAADATTLYWLAEDGKGHGILVKREIAAGPPTQLAGGLEVVPEIFQGLAAIPTNSLMALSATDVLFVEFLSRRRQGGVLQVPKDGGAVGTFLPMALPDAGTESPLNTVALLADGNSLVVADNNSFFSGILATNLAMAGPVRVLTDNLLFPSNLALDGNLVFFCDTGLSGKNGTIQSVPKSGGTPKILTSGLEVPWTLAVDDGFVYCGSLGLPVGGSIVKVALDGGTAIPVVPKVPQPFSLVVDARHTYWVDPVCKTVMSGPK